MKESQKLDEANSICVSANIRHKRHGDFRNHTQFLEHLRNQLLPIFGYRRQFEFHIGLVYDNYAVTEVITSILQMQQANECSNVGISLVIHNQYEELPTRTISNWLHRNRNGNINDGGNEFANQSQHERVLEIDAGKFSNVLEMCNHLKKVFAIFETL